MRSIRYDRSAAKALAKMPADVRAELIAKLGRYAATGQGDIRKLVGRPGSRLRVGDYRVILDEGSDEIIVVAAGHRRDVYR